MKIQTNKAQMSKRNIKNNNNRVGKRKFWHITVEKKAMEFHEQLQSQQTVPRLPATARPLNHPKVRKRFPTAPSMSDMIQ